jgi:hypothetical protein
MQMYRESTWCTVTVESVGPGTCLDVCISFCFCVYVSKVGVSLQYIFIFVPGHFIIAEYCVISFPLFSALLVRFGVHRNGAAQEQHHEPHQHGLWR